MDAVPICCPRWLKNLIFLTSKPVPSPGTDIAQI